MAASIEVVSAGLADPLATMGVDLEEVQIQRAGRREVVRVVIDRDGGIDLDMIAAASQVVSALLESEPLASQFVGAYVLEVTSPGVDRPLTRPAHWRRAIGRLVVAAMRDGSAVTGRIVGATDESVTLQPSVGEQVIVPLAELASGAVQVEFNRIDDIVVEEARE
jgi:ribosome maturation factor RimP